MNTGDKTTFSKEMAARYSVSLLVTLKLDGGIAVPMSIITVEALKVKAIDTIGAGDAFVGYFAGLDKGKPL